MAYLTSPDSKCMAYEFKQENESDMEFLEYFSKWMHEWPKVEGHVEYYLLMGLRYNKHLSEEQYEYLERNFCDCFSFSHGWYYELNHRVRYRLHITLVMSQNRNFRNLVKKEIPSHIKEKLAKYKFDFMCAYLGNKENTELFFENFSNSTPEFISKRFVSYQEIEALKRLDKAYAKYEKQNLGIINEIQ